MNCFQTHVDNQATSVVTVHNKDKVVTTTVAAVDSVVPKLATVVVK